MQALEPHLAAPGPRIIEEKHAATSPRAVAAARLANEISTREKEAESFAYDDGILVADALPGLFDSFCQEEDGEASAIAAELLEELAEDEDSLELLASPVALGAVTEQLRVGNKEHKEHASRILLRLSRIKGLQSALVDGGAIPLLTAVVLNGEGLARIRAAAALWNIAEINDLMASTKLIWTLLHLLRDAFKCYNIQGAINVKESVPILVQLLREGNAQAKEATLGVLCCIVKDSNDQSIHIKELLLRANSVPPLMSILRDRPPKKAIKLIKLLSTSPKLKALLVSSGVINVLTAIIQEGSREQLQLAIQTLLEISQFPSDIFVPLAQSDAVALLNLACDNHYDEEIQADVLAVLINLSIEKENRSGIGSAGAISLLIKLIECSNGPQRINAVTLLKSLALEDELEKQIGASGVILSLVGLLRDGNSEEKAETVVALQNLSVSMDNKERIAAAGGIQVLLDMVSSGTDSHRFSALCVLYNIGARYDPNKRRITSSGSLPMLIDLIPSPQKIQVVTLLKLLACEKSCRSLMVTAGVIAPLLELVSDGGGDVSRLRALSTLKLLALDAGHDTLIGSMGAIDLLVALVYDGDRDEKAEAALVLQNLSYHPENQERVVIAGGVDAMLSLAREGDDGQCTNALGTLITLTSKTSIRMMIASWDAIPSIVGLLGAGSVKKRTRATMLLNNLAAESENGLLVVSAGGIKALVGLLRDDESVVRLHSMEALRRLAQTVENRKMIVSEGVTPMLISLLVRGSLDEQTTAAGLLQDIGK